MRGITGTDPILFDTNIASQIFTKLGQRAIAKFVILASMTARREKGKDADVTGLEYFDQLAPLLQRLHEDACLVHQGLRTKRYATWQLNPNNEACCPARPFSSCVTACTATDRLVRPTWTASVRGI